MEKLLLYVSCLVICSVLIASGKSVFSNDLTGIRTAGNKLVNHKNQRVILRVSRCHAVTAVQ